MLLAPTPADWLPRARADLDTLLLDLAHCEKRAASTVLSFLFRCPEHGIAGTLSRVAREELTHFEWCLRELERRGRPFARLEPARYPGELAKRVRRHGDEALLDAFLVAALIEARSGERLLLLRDGVDDPPLAELFARLHPPEERHVEILLGLAARFGDVDARLPALAAHEAALIVPGEGTVRVHG